MHPNIRRLSLQLYFLSPSASQTQYASLNCGTSGIRRQYATTISAEDEGNGKTAQSRNPFPYPRHPRPSPYQIFHLPAGATQEQIKARYYELVKTHHPDSHHAAQLESELAHTRFRNIKAAYDFLRGRTLSPHPNARPTPSPRNFDPYMHELARRRRAYYASRSGYARGTEDGNQGESWSKSGWREGSRPGERTMWQEDGWRERLVFGLGMVTLLAGLFPTMPTTIASTFMPTSSYTISSVSDHSPNPSSTKPPSNATTTSFSLRFGIDLDKGHRDAVSALVQARNERGELGAERREGVRQRVRKISITESPEQIERTNDPPQVQAKHAGEINDRPAISGEVENIQTSSPSTLSSDQPTTEARFD